MDDAAGVHVREVEDRGAGLGTRSLFTSVTSYYTTTFLTGTKTRLFEKGYTHDHDARGIHGHGACSV